ncbi:hypothetical protein HMN09_00543700 [Mycena chlorophos]|uniref:Uncharacterized protein n=1 Tax=Mycena chlorophos TaxID=658473 RepID=A0A8H6WEQ3_MYCCL|nr:hypothetical protein HMN09_00543700 [Mycena chlorophos]
MSLSLALIPYPVVPLNLQRLAVPLHVQLSSTYSDDDALARYSSDSLFSSDYDTPSYVKRSPSVASDRSRRSVDSNKSTYSNESWPRPQAERPFLRIAVDHPSRLDPIPQSPPAHGSYSPPPAYSIQPAHASYTIPASRTTVPPRTSPAFATMPSSSSKRLAKMDRLRRTLGDGVPMDLVFPSQDSPLSSTSSSSEEDLPSPARSQRIRHARDSMLLAPAAPPVYSPPSPRSAKKLSIIAEREEGYLYQPPSPSERGSIDYEGDTEADAVRGDRRRSSQKIRRVPVPTA